MGEPAQTKGAAIHADTVAGVLTGRRIQVITGFVRAGSVRRNKKGAGSTERLLSSAFVTRIATIAEV
ncbi:MAG: hypothetical protein WAO98_08140 [Alphaproteobacteria bacterium]